MEENKKPLAEGEEKEETVSKNFIEREIDKDLAEGRLRSCPDEISSGTERISSYWTR